ncbi:mobile mystery protein B [Stieleria sp. ICT_E10.1]|uniref:mobile mystery protein B n=1 Tax=Stieleria sedimenti TaxID=2976331 RepID=UPI00217F9F58|nr:mobile mystery protein B [Stieleria sedimenti]MCS7465148.1 mobile mystery protein B [Stieleria sedimenti]
MIAGRSKGTGLGSSGKDDDTPFDGSGLKLKTIKTRRELNEVEFASILRVTEKYLLSKPSRKIAPFNFDWLLGLHREMLGSIWSWAGEIRSTEKNIGVSPNIIAAELGVIAMEADKRHNETGALVIATAAEFHHRAVWVHPFEDGNGRWARLLTNVWLMQHDQPATLWPATDLRDTESPIRDEYIAAIKAADSRNYGPLIDLHERFSE